MVIAENSHQNLISAATIHHIWARHIVDSAQLLSLHPRDGDRSWLDLGTGAGFPGMVAAILNDAEVTLVEERRLRHEFLSRCVGFLGLNSVTVHGGRLETLATAKFATISARAFAPLPKLLSLAHRFSRNETVWLLPKGKKAVDELESALAAWHGMFHVKQSLTDAEAAIIVATGVQPKAKSG